MAGEKPIAVYGALAANLVIAVAKFIAASIAGSAAMFAEGIHSLVDSGNQALLLVGIHRARKPADADHPFGRGKEVYFWGLIVAVLLFGVGGGISVYEGIHALSSPAPERGGVWLAYLVLGIAFAAESVSWGIALHVLRREEGETFWQKLHHSKDPAKFVVFGEDTAALAGLVVAFVGVFLGQLISSPVPDAIASIIIGAILGAVAIYLIEESRKLLIGESASREQLQTIRALTRSDPLVRRVGKALTMHLGPKDVLINLEVNFAVTASREELCAATNRIEARIRERYPEVKHVFLEAHL